MTYTDYIRDIDLAGTLDDISNIADRLDTDGEVTEAQAYKLADIAAERMLEILS